MLRNLFLLLFSLLLSNGAFTQSLVEISVPDLAGKEAYLIRSTDQISERWGEIINETIDDQGQVDFQVEINQPELVRFQSGSWYSVFYLTPNETVSVELSIGEGKRAKTFNANPLLIKLKEGTVGINQTVISLYQEIQEVERIASFDLASYFGQGSSAFKKAHKDELDATNMVTEEDSLRRSLTLDSLNLAFSTLKNKWLNQETDEYTERTIKAIIGQLALQFGHDLVEVRNDYFPDQVNPQSIEEVSLLEAWLNLQLLHSSTPRGSLQQKVVFGEYDKLREMLFSGISEEDEGLTLCMILLLSKKMYFMDEEAQFGALRILDQMSKEAEPYSALAKELRKELTRGSVRAENFLPEITLVDHKGDRVELGAFDGEFVYLSIVQTASLTAQRELMVMEKLERTYGRQINFVTIVVNESSKQLSNYLANVPNQDWTFLNGGGNPVLPYEMKLVSSPTFFLISPEGKLMFEYTKSPSEGVEAVFKRILKQ